MTRRPEVSRQLDAESFAAIAELAYRESGLTLARAKTPMIQSRLRQRLDALQLADFAAYSALVRSDRGVQERRHLISALTTNVSHFCREPHHFDRLAELAEARRGALRGGARMRVWSAGCAGGQEPISAAIHLATRFPELLSCDLRILGTDIDAQVIRFAQAARFPEKMIDSLPVLWRSRFFDMEGAGPDRCAVLRPRIRALLRFNELNLLRPWPMRHPFDAIFCRNVVIYFDTATQESLWPRFRAALADGGLLFIGHSERIADPAKHGFACVSPTTYRAVPA